MRDWAGARGGAEDPRPRPRAPLRARVPEGHGRPPAPRHLHPRGVRRRRAWTTSAWASSREELEYVDTHLRVIMSVHVGLNCMTLWCWGTEEQKKKYLVPQAKGEKIATYGLTEPNAGSRRGRDPDDGGQEGRPLRPERREDLDQPGRRGRQLPGHRLDRPGEEEEPRPQRALAPSSWSAAFKGFSSYTMKEKWGILAGNTGGFSHGRTSRCRSRTAWARRARASRSPCSPSRTAATRWRRAPPASSAPASTPRCSYAKERKTFGVPIGEHQLVKEMIARDGLRLRRRAPALAARRLAQERGQAQHPRDLPRQVVRDREERAGRLRLRADPRRQRLLRRVPGGPLLPELARPP